MRGVDVEGDSSGQATTRVRTPLQITWTPCRLDCERATGPYGTHGRPALTTESTGFAETHRPKPTRAFGNTRTNTTPNCGRSLASFGVEPGDGGRIDETADRSTGRTSRCAASRISSPSCADLASNHRSAKRSSFAKQSLPRDSSEANVSTNAWRTFDGAWGELRNPRWSSQTRDHAVQLHAEYRETNDKKRSRGTESPRIPRKDGCAGAQRGLNTAISLRFERRFAAASPRHRCRIRTSGAGGCQLSRRLIFTTWFQ
jgi:hypothetical protein